MTVAAHGASLLLLLGYWKKSSAEWCDWKILGKSREIAKNRKCPKDVSNVSWKKKGSKRSFSKPKGSIFSSCFGRSHKGHSPGTVPNSHSGVQFFEQCRPCQSLFQRQIFRSNPVRTQMFCRHLGCRVYNNNYRGYIPTNMVSFQSHSHIMSYPWIASTAPQNALSYVWVTDIDLSSFLSLHPYRSRNISCVFPGVPTFSNKGTTLLEKY